MTENAGDTPEAPIFIAKKTANIVEFLQEQAEEIEANRYKVVDKDCTPLQNIIDEIMGLYYGTIYKLRFLG